MVTASAGSVLFAPLEFAQRLCAEIPCSFPVIKWRGAVNFFHEDGEVGCAGESATRGDFADRQVSVCEKGSCGGKFEMADFRAQ